MAKEITKVITNEIDDKEKKEKTKKISIKEGSFASVMDGFGTRYITPYALALGASNFIVGLLASLPQLLANIAQLPVPGLMKNTTRKKMLVITVILEAFLWLPVLLIGFMYFFFHISTILAGDLLVIIYTLLIIAGSIPSPAWNSWMRDVVEEPSAEYFGKRNRITNFFLISAMVIAGIILNYFGNNNFIGFVIIFIIAFIGRLGSGYLLSKQYEPKFKFVEGYYFSPIDFIKKMPDNNFGRFVLSISLLTFATAIASPFFAVYMLKNLNFSYIQFMIVTLMNPIAALIFMPFWGRFANKFGNIKVLKITGLLIPLTPLMWVVTLVLPKSTNIIFIYLILAETFSGFYWAGFNLSSVNFVYDAVTKERMALCFCYYNIIVAIGTFIGAVLGGILTSYSIIFGISSILFAFIISGVLRFIFYLMTVPQIKEVRPVKDININKKIQTKVKGYFGIKTPEIELIKE